MYIDGIGEIDEELSQEEIIIVQSYPVEGFGTIYAAREWVNGFVEWYNNEHYHSGLNFATPNSRHNGTAEKIFHGFNGYDVRSAGTEEGARVKVTNVHIGWSDIIFVMEKKHVRRLKEKFNGNMAGKKVINLDIPDDYMYMDEELIEILKSRVSEYLNVPD